jgi:isoquinoline 1-oxidoreductase subunit beta
MASRLRLGEITIKRGRVEQTNFDEYQVVWLMRLGSKSIWPSRAVRNGAPSASPGTAATAPAVANAVFAATGTRVRSLPLKNVKLPGPV